MNTYTLDRQLVHIHFPKTAGTAFAQHLVPVLGDRLAVASWPEAERDDISRFAWVHGHIYFDQMERLTEKPILTTMLRHPIERILSLYRFHQRRPEDPMYEMANSHTFHEFVEKRVGSQVYVSMLADSVPPGAEAPSPSLKGRDRVELALERLDRFDVIGITEHFDYSLLMLCSELNIEPFWRVSTANSAPTPTTRKDIEPETLKLIRQVAGADIEVYERALDLFRMRVRERLGITARP